MVYQPKTGQIFEKTCRIVSVNRISEFGFVHEYEFPDLAHRALPGQFVQIRVSGNSVPLLRRPFSVLTTDAGKGTFSILFKVFGDATKILSGRKEGEFVDILGPLGNSFVIQPYDTVYCVGGGIGIPPIYNLLTSADLTGKRIRLFFGAVTADELWYADEIRKLDFPVEFATDDGTAGEKGFVTDPLERALSAGKNDGKSCICACGPMPMLKSVQRIAEHHSIPTQLSVETVMACGFGICVGCAVPKKGGGYALACTDGPVFSGGELEL